MSADAFGNHQYSVPANAGNCDGAEFQAIR